MTEAQNYMTSDSFKVKFFIRDGPINIPKKFFLYSKAKKWTAAVRIEREDSRE